MQFAPSLRLLAVSAVIASLTACSAKMTEADIHQVMADIDQATQQRDVAVLERVLAPQAEIEIDMRVANLPEPLKMNKGQYLQLLKAGWAEAGTSYQYERSNTRINMAPGGKAATASATVKETSKIQGQVMTSVSDEVATFVLKDGKPQVTKVRGVVLSMQ